MRIDVENAVRQLKGDVELMNKSELSRRFGCNWRTIDRYLNVENEPERKQRNIPSKLDDYKATIIEKVDKYGSSSMAVFKFISKKGYEGKYGTVNNFVKSYKDVSRKKATIRFETTPGLQAQVDWKEELKLVNRNGEQFVINIFLIVLGYSRLKFVKLTNNKVQDTLFRCMVDSFQYFGGIPREILFDNMSTVVDRSRSTFHDVVINKNFKYFSLDAGFEILTCRPYRPMTKGKVETLAKLTSRLIPYNEEFDTFEDLEKIVNEFNEDINNEISQGTNEVPFDRFLKEKEYLNPLPSMDSLISYFLQEKEYKVTYESMIKYKGKKYSVPTRYIGFNLTVDESDNEICIYYTRDLIVCHRITDKVLHYKYDHAKEILKSDAFSHLSDNKIDFFIENNLRQMDIFLDMED